MKTTNGNYILSMKIELTPEEIAVILDNQVDIVEEEIGSHEVIGHLRSFINENIHHITERLLKSYDESILETIRPLLKERKKK